MSSSSMAVNMTTSNDDSFTFAGSQSSVDSYAPSVMPSVVQTVPTIDEELDTKEVDTKIDTKTTSKKRKYTKKQSNEKAKDANEKDANEKDANEDQVKTKSRRRMDHISMASIKRHFLTNNIKLSSTEIEQIKEDLKKMNFKYMDTIIVDRDQEKQILHLKEVIEEPNAP